MVDGRADQTYNIGDTVYYIESYLDVASSKIKETTILCISGEHSLYCLSDGSCFHFGEENKVFFKDKIKMLLTLIEMHTEQLKERSIFHTRCIQKYNELLQEETNTNVK